MLQFQSEMVLFAIQVKTWYNIYITPDTPEIHLIQDLRNFDSGTKVSGSFGRCTWRLRHISLFAYIFPFFALFSIKSMCFYPDTPEIHLIQDLRNFDHSPRCEMKAPVKNTAGSRAQTNSLCYKRATCVSPMIDT